MVLPVLIATAAPGGPAVYRGAAAKSRIFPFTLSVDDGPGEGSGHGRLRYEHFTLLLLGCCLSLWNEITLAGGFSVLIRAPLDGRDGLRRLPFERGGLPRILAGRGSVARAPKEVYQEEQLRHSQDEGRPSDATLHG